MSLRQRFFQDAAAAASGAVGIASGISEEIRQFIRARVEEKMDRLDLVKRDEFEAVRKMAEKARLENEELRREIEALKGTPKKKAPVKKASAKKPAAKTTAKKTPKKTTQKKSAKN